MLLIAVTKYKVFLAHFESPLCRRMPMSIAALTQEVGTYVSGHTEYSVKEQTEMTAGILTAFYF